MRQIGLRQEAARVGGIGSCGRELCCTTWLTDFRSVNTSAARYQRLSLNPQKLAGQCGKLKCCLNFELDVYVDALRNFPSSDIPLQTEKGNANFQKLDVFKGMYWYAYDFEYMNWIGLTVDAVRKIQQINRRGGKVESLEMFVEQENEKPKNPRQNLGEMKSIEEDELTRFDKKKNKPRIADNQNANPAEQSTGQNPSAPRGDRNNRPERNDQRQDRPQRPERPDRQNRPQRPERPDRQERVERRPDYQRIENRNNNSDKTTQVSNAENRQVGNTDRRNLRNNRNNNNRRNNNSNRPPRGENNRPPREQNGSADSRNDNKNE